MLRYVFVDMNSFFASVEQQEDERLRGRAVGVVPVVAESSCCIAASYEAKAYGVKTGTGVREAKRLCPKIQLVLARPALYVQYHHRIIAAVERCLHVDHVCSIDEMYGRLFSNEREPEQAAMIAHAVKGAIHEAVGEAMRCSIGVAPNPWLAKVASNLKKPDGLTMILPEQMPEAIGALKLTDLPGIAKNMERRLDQHRIRSVHELCAASLEQLSKAWGSTVLGSIWWHQLRGDDLPYRPTQRRTVGHSHVLPPQWRTIDGAHAVAVRMIHKAAARLRRIGYWAGCLTVTVKCLNDHYWQRRTILGLCRDTLTMLQAFETIWEDPPLGIPYHVGVVLTDLTINGSATQPLYTDQKRRNDLADVMDRVDQRFGHHAVYFGGMFGAKETAPVRISFTQIPEVDEF